jgi:hypothetical protein
MGVDDAELMAFTRAVALGDDGAVSQMLGSSPELAAAPLRRGATRQSAETFYIDEIQHYVYAGDAPLHVAAAGPRLALSDPRTSSQ